LNYQQRWIDGPVDLRVILAVSGVRSNTLMISAQ
jgi:hypothetical protein